MTNEQIITIAMAIPVAIVSAFSKSLFDKFLAEYKPDIKKIKSRTIFISLLFLRFVIPFIALVYIYFKTDVIDKVFVVSFSTISFIFIFNIFYDVFIKYVDKRQEESKNAIIELMNLIAKTELKTGDKITELYDLTSQHISITEQLIDRKPNP